MKGSVDKRSALLMEWLKKGRDGNMGRAFVGRHLGLSMEHTVSSPSRRL